MVQKPGGYTFADLREGRNTSYASGRDCGDPCRAAGLRVLSRGALDLILYVANNGGRLPKVTRRPFWRVLANFESGAE
jgi:hypothetical protein